MLFSKHPKSIDSLLFKIGQAEKLAESRERPKDSDLTGSLFLIFSVQEIVEFKQDAHKLVHGLTTLCRLGTYVLAAAVAMWLLEVLLPQ